MRPLLSDNILKNFKDEYDKNVSIINIDDWSSLYLKKYYDKYGPKSESEFYITISNLLCIC